MDDETAARLGRQAKELDDLRNALERSRERVGVDSEELRGVVDTALERAGLTFAATQSGAVGNTTLFRLDPAHPTFQSAGWPEALDDLRVRRRGRSEKLKDWRATSPLRAVSFKPAITQEGADAEGVVQLHLEHRLVRRLLSRFLSQGFQSGLSRACVVLGPGAQPRVVLLGRMALYGPAAARLHEEIIPVTAAWTEAGRGTKPLRAFGVIREEATFDDDASARGKASSLGQMRRLIVSDQRNGERIYPDLGGEEVNTSPLHAHHRWCIDFNDYPLCREVMPRTWSQMTESERAACRTQASHREGLEQGGAASFSESALPSVSLGRRGSGGRGMRISSASV